MRLSRVICVPLLLCIVTRMSYGRRLVRLRVSERMLLPLARFKTWPPVVADADTIRAPCTRGRLTATLLLQLAVAGPAAGGLVQSTVRSSGPSVFTSSVGWQLRRARAASTVAVLTFVATTSSLSTRGVFGAGVQSCERSAYGVGPCAPPFSVPAPYCRPVGLPSPTPNASLRASKVPSCAAFGSRTLNADAQYAWFATMFAFGASSVGSTT